MHQKQCSWLLVEHKEYITTDYTNSILLKKIPLKEFNNLNTHIGVVINENLDWSDGINYIKRYHQKSFK